MATTEKKTDSLVPLKGHDGRDGAAANGNGRAASSSSSSLVTSTRGTRAPKPTRQEAAANGTRDAAAHFVEAKRRASEAARGWRGWWRTLQVARVLGTLGFYLFLENYEARAKFNRRMSARRLEEARRRGRGALLRAQAHDLFSRALDRSIRLVRHVVFRGADASSSKEARLQQQAVWLKTRLIKLGPTFIKIGQSLGTRGDLLPLAYVKELSLLQDQVPAFPTTEAYTRIEAELGRTLQEAYAEIDAAPVAAASLGQVYRARLHTGEEVAVKVQRPHLAETVSLDIAVLRRIVARMSRYPSFNENADWAGMLEEFEETIFEEMDYAQEARNAERFRENFKTWRAIHVPRIHFSHSTARVLTMEFIRGTKVVELEALRARRISPVKVNRLLIRTYLKQLLEDGFFHADPHPGNLLVMDDGRLAFFDFGMTGRITPRLQSQMIDAFFHVVARDVHGLAQDLINLNFLKPGVDPELVRPVVEGLFSHYLNLRLGEVNFKELTYELAEVMYEYPFRLPSNFTYIMRALMTLEGIGLVTDPGFSFFETAKPYAKEFMLRREGKQFRKLLLDKFMGRDTEDGRIEWGKMWKLAKMAAKSYLEK
ncbi:MAG TPA: AarF/ABC1/UbiB kinase family protein [Pyrinomonadaceae bacterium]|jgi:predicted unusual protein kinase regulating ubiquinone biosynthesis (AarF/ABC1/UbiB family)